MSHLLDITKVGKGFLFKDLRKFNQSYRYLSCSYNLGFQVSKIFQDSTFQINRHSPSFDGLRLIEVQFSGGQPKLGTEKGPSHLRSGLVDSFKSHFDHDCFNIIQVNLKDLDNGRTPSCCSEACLRISKNISEQAKMCNFCFNVGGDHSIGTGTLSGIMDAYPDLFVIWIDAHADINTYQASTSKNIHGMPLSFLIDDQKIIDEKIPEYRWTNKYRLNPKNLTYIGLRDVEPFEQALIEKLNILSYPISKISDETIDEMMDTIASRIKKGQPVHVSYDVDAMDPEFSPSTGTPVKNGITLKQMLRIGNYVRENFNLVGLDLVEVNPLLGEEKDVETTRRNAIITATNFVKKQPQ